MAFNATKAADAGNCESLYLGGQYAEILDFLCSPVTGLANVKVLVSGPGLGKTVLLRSALERIKAEARTAFVFWTLFKPKDFVTHLLFEMGATKRPPSDPNAAQDQFENLLRRAAADGKRFVLAIDEAHNLSPAALRRLAALLDRDTSRPPQITVLLAGLPGLHDRLADPEASGIRKRIAGAMSIAPLDAEQTAEYVGARISALGAGPVAPEHLANIAANSGGVLRTIDKLCHQLLSQSETRLRTNDALRVETAVNESAIATDVHVAHIAAWATDHSTMWSGTVAELAAATGISLKEISDVVENRTQELRGAGIAAVIQRSPGRPRMITLSHVEDEQAPEPRGAIPELHEEDANPQPKHEDQVPETEPVRHQEAVIQTRLDSTKAVGESSSANRRTGGALRPAFVLALIMAAAGGLLYLLFSNSAHRAASVSQRVSETKQPPQAGEATGLPKRAEAGDTASQAALGERYREGDGVLRDDKAGMALYEQAAVKGNSAAQHRLGLALFSGSGGVAADRVAAYAWLVMARDGGQVIDPATLDSLNHTLTPNEIIEVRYRLGVMYERGIGCAPDLVFADEWFLLGAAVGDVRSRAASSALEPSMSPAQISQAHARADVWLRSHTISPASHADAR